MRHRLARLAILCAIASAAAPALAARDLYVPPELEPWVPWVLEDHEDLPCPVAMTTGSGETTRVCAWPGALELDVDAGEAGFRQAWRVLVPGFVPLPGNETLWPRDVTVGGRPAVVTSASGRPRIRLEAGVHQVSGNIPWDQRPATLPVPDRAGIIRLVLDGEPVPQPRRSGDELWLGRPADSAAGGAALNAVVYRRLADGLPAMLETRLTLDVSGPEREVLMGRILAPGFLPVALEGGLPARVEADGQLRVQVRPGRWQLVLSARAEGVLDGAGPGAPGEPWPDEEIWSYASAEHLRVTRATGASPVDPAQAGVPPEWRPLPAFRLTPGDRLGIEELARGRPQGLDNSLVLRRQLWLDFDGAGLTAVDEVSGRMRVDWRLGMRPPWSLEGARLGGEPLLVTVDEHGHTGVEIRERDLALTAISRLASGGRVPAAGWDSDFESVSMELNLPAGTRLLAVPGADTARGAWASRWTLLDFFLLLLTAGAFARLAGWRWGAVAVAGLAIFWHEPGLPAGLWLAVLAGIALARIAPEGRLRRWSIVYRNLALAVLVIAVLPFLGGQLTRALYPQLDTGAAPGPGHADLATMAPARDAAASLERAAKMAIEEVEAPGDRRFPSAAPATEPPPRYAPGTLVQTGPGIPQWRQRVHPVHFAGPVAAGQEMRLVVLGRGVVRLLRVAGAVLVVLLVLRLARMSFPRLTLPGRLASGSAAALLAAIPLLLGPGTPPEAADTPDPRILEELERRLIRPPECLPGCVEISHAEIAVRPGSLRMALVAHAAAPITLPIPGDEGWRPDTVSVDGRGNGELVRMPDGTLHLALAPGLHVVSLSGPLGGIDELRLAFPLPPHRIGVDARGWSVAGIEEGRLPGGVLQLIRESASEAEEAAPLEPGRFPVFLRVQRTLALGLDWRASTRVELVSPATGGVEVSVPLLPGESVTASPDHVEVSGDAVVIRFPRARPGFSETGYESVLEKSASLRLPGPEDLGRAETWQVSVGPQWHPVFSGTPMLAIDERDLWGTWVAEFRPRPGEFLEIALARPAPADGSTLVFDAVSLETRAGRRSASSTLALSYRSTLGGPHVITLPADADLAELTSDGRALSERPVDGRLVLPIAPGEHRLQVRFEQDRALSLMTRTPEIGLGAAAGNVAQALALGERWVLWTTGPGDGPAVLYWSELLVFLLLAWALARLARAPLAFHQWLLLGLGFSTFSWEILLLLVLWLHLTAWRERARMPEDPTRYNLLQAGYVLATVFVLAQLVAAVPRAMLGSPRMHVVGNGSTPELLRWFSDRVAGALPEAGVLSLPLWSYKLVILAWALWLAFALLAWLPWAWRAWSRDGIWRGEVTLPRLRRGGKRDAGAAGESGGG